MITITTAPVGQGRFRASVAGRVLCTSSTPFFASARVLQREGVSAEAPLQLVDEVTGMVCLRSTVGAAARLTVEETSTRGPRITAHRPWSADRPFPVSSGGQERQQPVPGTLPSPEPLAAAGEATCV